MCTSLFRQQRQAAVQPMPTPSPAPVPTPSETSGQLAGESRRKRLERLRGGFGSTIRSGGRGITGRGADLSAPSSGKTLLGG
jgi:hypothetical protein